jgi:putative transposase
MKSISTKSDSSQPAADTAAYLFDDWFDPIEAGVRDQVREFIQAMVEGELDVTLMRRRYGRRPKSTSDDDDGLVAVTGHRHGRRSRSLTGTFGRVEIEVPRGRLHGQDGKTTEWNSKVLRAYQRLRWTGLITGSAKQHARVVLRKSNHAGRFRQPHRAAWLSDRGAQSLLV